VSTDDAFNLPAAALRADSAELGMSVDALATTLEQALPRIASVERRRVGGFRSKRKEVQRIVVALGDDQLELHQTEHGPQCTRHKVVRGITLSRQELPMADWIAELVAGVSASAEVQERDRIALEGLLR
jgi:osmotically-inducible protein OsmY